MESVTTTFLQEKGIQLKRMRKKVYSIINSDIKEKPYVINKDRLLQDYNNLNHGCIDEFSTNYSFGYFMSKPSFDSPVLREAFLIEIKSILQELDAKGLLISKF